LAEAAALSLSPDSQAASTGARQQCVERMAGLVPAAYRLAVRVLGTSEGAEDIVQQACLEAIHRIRTDRSPTELRPWFLRVVALCARKHLRSERTRKRKEADLDMLPAKRNDADEVNAETVQLLRSAMTDLDRKFRVPVALCCEEGLSQAETAAILDLPPRTVSKYVQVGLERLRKLLGEAGCAVGSAALLEGLGLSAPTVPAGLAAGAKTLMTGSIAGKVAAGSGVAGATAGATAAWKVLTGICLAVSIAGLSIGYLAWPGRKGPEDTGAQKSSAERTDPAAGKNSRAPKLPATREGLDRRICDLIVDYRPEKARELKSLLLEGYRRYSWPDYLSSYATMVKPEDADAIEAVIRQKDLPLTDPEHAKKAKGETLFWSRDGRRERLLRLLASLDRARALKIARELWDQHPERGASAAILAEFGTGDDRKWLLTKIEKGKLSGVRATCISLRPIAGDPTVKVMALKQFLKDHPKKGYPNTIARFVSYPPNSLPVLEYLKLKQQGVDLDDIEALLVAARKRTPKLDAKNLRHWANVGLSTEALSDLKKQYPALSAKRSIYTKRALAGVLASLWATSSEREWIGTLAKGSERNRQIVTLACLLWPPMAREHEEMLKRLADGPRAKMGLDYRRWAREALAGSSPAQANKYLAQAEAHKLTWSAPRYLQAARGEKDYAALFEVIFSRRGIERHLPGEMLKCASRHWLDDHIGFRKAAQRYLETHPRKLEELLDSLFPANLSVGRKGRLRVLTGLHVIGGLTHLDPDDIFARMLASGRDEDAVRALTYFNRVSYGRYALHKGASGDRQAAAFRQMSKKAKLRVMTLDLSCISPPLCAEMLKLVSGTDPELAEAACLALSKYVPSRSPAYLRPLFSDWLKSDNPWRLACAASLTASRLERSSKPEKKHKAMSVIATRLPKMHGLPLALTIRACCKLSPHNRSRALSAWPTLKARERAELVEVMLGPCTDAPVSRRYLDPVLDQLAATNDLHYRWALVEANLLSSHFANAQYKKAPDALYGIEKLSAALPGIILDTRDPKLQGYAAYCAARLPLKDRTGIRRAIEKALKSCRDPGMASLMKHSLEKIDGSPARSEPEEPPEVF